MVVIPTGTPLFFRVALSSTHVYRCTAAVCGVDRTPPSYSFCLCSHLPSSPSLPPSVPPSLCTHFRLTPARSFVRTARTENQRAPTLPYPTHPTQPNPAQPYPTHAHVILPISRLVLPGHRVSPRRPTAPPTSRMRPPADSGEQLQPYRSPQLRPPATQPSPRS